MMHYLVWTPDEEPKAVVLILHGMAEHAARYSGFAQFLADNGYAVYVPDHRGHGPLAEEEGTLGWFGEEEGGRKVVEDIMIGMVSEIIGEDFPSKEVFLFGHSMGSFIGRCAIALYPNTFSGAVFSGTGTVGFLASKFGQYLAQHEVDKYGSSHPSVAMNKLSFGSYNKRFESEGEFSWLSRDRAEVNKYINDPLCGFICTSGFFRDFMGGINFACSPDSAAMVSKSLPILFVSGSDDPVGAFGKGVKQACELYRAAGVRDVTLYIEEGGRHELLNDITRDKIQHIILGWLDERL